MYGLDCIYLNISLFIFRISDISGEENEKNSKIDAPKEKIKFVDDDEDDDEGNESDNDIYIF